MLCDDGIKIGIFVTSPIPMTMKKLTWKCLLIALGSLASCVSSEKFKTVLTERDALEEQVETLREEVERKDNLIFFLESEIQYVQRQKGRK